MLPNQRRETVTAFVSISGFVCAQQRPLTVDGWIAGKCDKVNITAEGTLTGGQFHDAYRIQSVVDKVFIVANIFAIFIQQRQDLLAQSFFADDSRQQRSFGHYLPIALGGVTQRHQVFFTREVRYAIGHHKRLDIAHENASMAVVRQPMWAYIPHMIS